MWWSTKVNQIVWDKANFVGPQNQTIALEGVAARYGRDELLIIEHVNYLIEGPDYTHQNTRIFRFGNAKLIHLSVDHMTWEGDFVYEVDEEKELSVGTRVEFTI